MFSNKEQIKQGYVLESRTIIKIYLDVPKK